MFFRITFQFGVHEESATRISGAAFSLFLYFVFIFVRTENPTSHLYVVVKGISNSMLALLKTVYSDEMLTQNYDNVMDSCLLLSDSGLSKSKGFWIHLLSCKMSYLSLGK